MYITSIDFTASPDGSPVLSGKPLHLSALRVREMGIEKAADVRGFVRYLDAQDQITADWTTWNHDEQARQGSVNLLVQRDELPRYESLMAWKYEALDDLDTLEALPIPEDENTKVLSVLSTTQRKKFWDCVNLQADAFDIVSVVLDRFDLEPREPDALDRQVLQAWLAHDWYAAFPSMEAAEQALDARPDLTDFTVGLLAAMGCRCGLFGEDADLYRVLVAPQA